MGTSDSRWAQTLYVPIFGSVKLSANSGGWLDESETALYSSRTRQGDSIISKERPYWLTHQLQHEMKGTWQMNTRTSAETRLSRASLTILGSIAALLAAGPASGAETIYLVNTLWGYTIEMYDTTTGADLGVFASTGLSIASGLAFDSAGNLYVPNSGDGTIEKFTTNGVGSVIAAGLGAPCGLAIDSAGNLYVGNDSNASIEKFTTNGVGSVFAANVGSASSGLVFDDAGNLYVDFSGTIEKFTTNGVGSVFAFTASGDSRGMAFDRTGNLYVAIYSSGLIQEFTPGGNASVFVSSGLSNPAGLVFDSGGILYVSDNSGIKEFGPDGTYLGGFSTGQNGPGIIAIRAGNPPLIAICPSNFTVTATGPNGASVFYASTNAGGCSGASISCSPPSGSTFPIGTTTVSCLATDSCGQTDLCSFTVTVVEPPLLAICPPNIRVGTTTLSGATVFYTSTTSGGCIGASVTCNPPSGSLFPIGTTTVSCLATDACGQTDACAFTVTVRLAATNIVSSLADSGPGSLRQVMTDSDVGDIIVFRVSGTIVLASGELLVDKDLAIIGPSTGVLAISGGGASRVFNINSNVTALISSLTVTNGCAPGNGGGICNAGTLRLDNLILSGNTTVNGTNGASTGFYGQPGGAGGSGGGLWNGGTCFANGCSFRGNSTAAGGSGGLGKYGAGSGGAGGSGGGIFNAGTMALTNGTVSNNSCGGGGNGGGSDFASGSGGSGGCGGGIYSENSFVLIGSAVISNRTGRGSYGGPAGDGSHGGGGYGGDGGGIFAAGLLVLTNCTVAGNSCGNGGLAGSGGIWGPNGPDGRGGSGGGIYYYYYPYATQEVMVACTVASNITGAGGSAAAPSGSGGGVYAYQYSTLYCFLDNIVALNSALTNGQGPDVYGAFSSLGYNLVGATNDSTGFTAPGDLTGSLASPLDPKLGPLADNGGPTLTMALLPGSPAIDAADPAGAPVTDQRGIARPVGPAPDIGAYEYGLPPVLRISGSQATGLDIVVSAYPGKDFRLLASSSLSNWIPIATNQVGTNGTLLLHEAWASSGTGRFYRVVMP